MELGVDVGDLDRVIQIDAPSTVSGFLQRLGRTGRRGDTERNCLFLATHDFALLQAAAILRLWSQGFVEEVVPPPIPYHVFAQQFFTLVLQNSDFTKSDWLDWIGKVPAFSELQDGRADAIISFALKQNLLGEDGGRLHLGPEAEKRLGQRHFSELLSVVTSQPLFQIRYGRQEIGHVHPVSFSSSKGDPPILSLGGRGWRLMHVDWVRKIAYVEPAQESGRSRWMGSSIKLSPTLCAAIRDLLLSIEENPSWSLRAVDRLAELREDLCSFCDDGTVIARNGQTSKWGTFAGLAANLTVVKYVQPYFESSLRADNLWIALPSELTQEKLKNAIHEILNDDNPPDWELQEPAADLIKFGDLLPEKLLRDLIIARIADIYCARKILSSPIRME